LIVDVLFAGAGEYRGSYPVMGIVMGLFLFNMTGLDIFMALVIFFLKDILAIPEELTFVIMGIPLISAVAAAPFWSWFGQRLGKRHAYLVSVLLISVCMLMFNVVPAGAIVPTIILAVLAGFAISALQIIPFSILPDVIEFDESKNGVRREGAFYGISTFLYKLASAGAVGIASLGLSMSGYIEGSVISQPKQALLAIRLIFTGGTVFFLLISAYLAIKLPITRERFEEIKQSNAKTAEEASLS
jgi:GPH family glycoside/pentoside/hexuronide:cation symporter